MRIMLQSQALCQSIGSEQRVMMKNTERHQDQVAASQPYEGFCFAPVVHHERCREAVQHAELPAQYIDDTPATRYKQRGLI